MKIKKSTKHEDLFHISSDVVAGGNENSIMTSINCMDLKIEDYQKKARITFG